MYRLWREQILYQILAQSNNLQLSYSDLNFKGWKFGDKSTLNFTVSEFQWLHDFSRCIMHSHSLAKSVNLWLSSSDLEI